MTRIFHALWKAFVDLFHPRMLFLLFLPPILSLVVWGLLAYLFWGQIFQFSQFFGQKFLFVQDLPTWVREWFSVTPEDVTSALAVLMAVLLILPMTILTSLLITSVAVMPIVLQHLGKRHPQIEKRGRGAFVASIRNLVLSSSIYLGLWILTLPLWMIPGFGVAISLLLNGYLNYRLFAFDALADHSTPKEIETILRYRRVDFLLLGVITSAFMLFPPLFLILPIYSALAFVHYAFACLKDQRIRAGGVTG